MPVLRIRGMCRLLFCAPRSKLTTLRTALFAKKRAGSSNTVTGILPDLRERDRERDIYADVTKFENVSNVSMDGMGCVFCCFGGF